MGSVAPNLVIFNAHITKWNGRTSTKVEEKEAVHGEEQGAD